MAYSIENEVIKRIRGHGVGWSFSAKDLTDLGSRQAVDVALHRLCAAGSVRRLMRGVYDLPRVSRVSGKPAEPDVFAVAATIARKNGWRIVASDAAVLNAVGLSTQVPARHVFYTDGRAASYQLGQTTIDFQRRAPKQIRAAPGRAGLALQALRALGRNGADEAAMRRLRRQLTQRDVAAVRHAARYASDWVRQLTKQL